MRLGATFALLAGLALAQEPASESSCVTNCHTKEATSFRDCVHNGSMRCVDCHGGNPAALRDKDKSHDPAAGFLGKLTRDKVPELCGRCHSDPVRMHPYGLKTDQLEHYRTSKHGQALFGKGDLAVAVCTDCHGTHRIRPAHDPRSMTAPANQPQTCGRCHTNNSRDIAAEFSASVHGRAVGDGLRGAPSCADCHDAHGATPPGVSDIVHVCGRCHTNTAAHFRKSPHFTADMRCDSCHKEADEQGPEYRGAGCTTCHGVHAIERPGAHMLQGDDVGHCGHCHRDDDRAAEEVTAVILGGTRRLAGALRESQARIDEAKALGVFLDNEKIYLRESRRALVSVQPLAHSLDSAAIAAHLDLGLKRQGRTREMIEKRSVALRDRKLLVVALALILSLLAGLLAMKLKAIRELS
ncbi:MAG: hypothetical protein ACYTGN_02770 [Planctomycetota bacterium]|jgi:hypothetical protein